MQKAVLPKLPTCDWCNARDAKFDTPTTLGPWGNLCAECFVLHGIETSVTTELVLEEVNQ